MFFAFCYKQFIECCIREKMRPLSSSWVAAFWAILCEWRPWRMAGSWKSSWMCSRLPDGPSATTIWTSWRLSEEFFYVCCHDVWGRHRSLTLQLWPRSLRPRFLKSLCAQAMELIAGIEQIYRSPSSGPNAKQIPWYSMHWYALREPFSNVKNTFWFLLNMFLIVFMNSEACATNDAGRVRLDHLLRLHGFGLACRRLHALDVLQSEPWSPLGPWNSQSLGSKKATLSPGSSASIASKVLQRAVVNKNEHTVHHTSI